MKKIYSFIGVLIAIVVIVALLFLFDPSLLGGILGGTSILSPSPAPFPSSLSGMSEIAARSSNQSINNLPGVNSNAIISSSVVTYASTNKELMLMQVIFSNQTIAQNEYQSFIKNATNNMPSNATLISNLPSNYFGAYFKTNSNLGLSMVYAMVGQGNARICIGSIENKSSLYNSSMIQTIESSINNCLYKYYLPKNQSNYTNSTAINAIAQSAPAQNQPGNYISPYPSDIGTNIGNFKRVYAEANPISNTSHNIIINNTVNGYVNANSSISININRLVYINSSASQSSFNATASYYTGPNVPNTITVISGMPKNTIGYYMEISQNKLMEYNFAALNNNTVCYINMQVNGNTIYNQNLVTMISTTFIPICINVH